MEEQRKIVEQATNLDRLLSEPGWKTILELMANKVNATIVGATTPPENGEGIVENALAKTIQITRWDAQRELLDAVQGHIKFVREERDRIEEERRFVEAGREP